MRSSSDETVKRRDDTNCDRHRKKKNLNRREKKRNLPFHVCKAKKKKRSDKIYFNHFSFCINFDVLPQKSEERFYPFITRSCLLRPFFSVAPICSFSFYLLFSFFFLSSFTTSFFGDIETPSLSKKDSSFSLVLLFFSIRLMCAHLSVYFRQTSGFCVGIFFSQFLPFFLLQLCLSLQSHVILNKMQY